MTKAPTWCKRQKRATRRVTGSRQAFRSKDSALIIDSSQVLFWLFRGQHEVVLQLLQQDALKVHSKDANGFTALHHVARKGNAALAKDLLRYRADVAAADLWGHSNEA